MTGFSEIIGHERVVRSLNNAITRGKISHAYIFSGARGSGKSLVAGSFAKALQCEDFLGCGQCISCRVFESGNHPDIFYISPSGKSLGVEEIREKVIKKMETGPYSYRYKIFIIDQAHKMTVQAQNALLKTIEEPAGYGVFLLLAEGLGMFLPTVLSRCVTYKLEPLAYELVEGCLIDAGVSPEAARLAATYSQGSIGRGLELSADGEFTSMSDKLFEIMERLPAADLTQVFGLAKEFEPFKERIQEALDIVYLWYRDLLVLRLADRRFLIQEGRQLGGEVFTGLSAVWRAKRRLAHYANFQLTIEVMLIDIWRRSNI